LLKVGKKLKLKVFHKQAGSTQMWKRCAWYGLGLFQVIVFLAAAVKPANAYVDPGSGLLFIQVGGSMLAGAMFVLRAKLRKLFRLGNPTKTEDQPKTEAVGEANAGTNA
jgi:hypothetical protein